MTIMTRQVSSRPCRRQPDDLLGCAVDPRPRFSTEQHVIENSSRGVSKKTTSHAQLPQPASALEGAHPNWRFAHFSIA